MGSPTVDGDRVFFGLGNGRLMRSAEPPARPAGVVLCLDAASGRRRWDYPVSDAVLAKPVVDGGRVYFGCRDGRCYAVDCEDGHLLWSHAVGGPIVSRTPVREGRVYALASDGRLDCLDARSGTRLWTFD